MPLQPTTEFLPAGKELELVKGNIQFQVSMITFAICPTFSKPFWTCHHFDEWKFLLCYLKLNSD